MLKLNCDLGEGAGNDAQIYPLIDQANIACGGHAGSRESMEANIRLAKKYDVEIGAHPGYDDRENFGRISIPMSPQSLRSMLQEQIGTLDAIARSHGMKLSYVKPHGALYNDMMHDKIIFETIAYAVYDYDPALSLMILSTGNHASHKRFAASLGLTLYRELFADRNYASDGRLAPRAQADAVIHDQNQIVQRIKHYLDTGHLLSQDGTPLALQGDSLCVHGDNPEARAIIEALRDAL